MSKTPSVRKNYIYNLIYQVMTLITPFITTPYISRVLGADGTGIQSYTNSVVQYFAILAALGTASYGQREIARHRDDLKMRSRLFWEIEMLCMATTAACLIIWLFVIGFAKEYRPYYIVLTMTLTAVAFDISWFFGGLEQYSLIVLRKYGSEAYWHCYAVFIYPGKRRPSAVRGADCGNRTSGKHLYVGVFKGTGRKAGFKGTLSFAPFKRDFGLFYSYYCHFRVYHSG